MSCGVSFVTIGIAICYCYTTLRESNKVDTTKHWYDLNFLESLAIVYCILISSIRANWVFFTAILQFGTIGVLVILGWYLLYNIEEIKNMVILIIRQNSLEGENNLETDLTENSICENENETIELKIENAVEESFLDIDKNLEILGPQIDKIIENINVDTGKFMEYVEYEEEEENTREISNTEQLVSELERITDNLVRDTRKIADNVSLVSTMSSGIESKIFANENIVLNVTPVASKASMKMENIEEDLEKRIPESTMKNDIIPVPLEMDMSSEYKYKESEIEETARIISNTENIAENMFNAIENFVEAINM